MELLLLWFNTLLPTLLPFMIISNLIVNTKAIDLLIKWFSPVFCRLFHTSRYGVFAVICGFFCGYPMGCKVTCDLLANGQININEAKYLLSFCNNTSPMFLISFVMLQNLNCKYLVIPSIIIFYLSPVICSFFFRKIYQVQSLNFPQIPAFTRLDSESFGLFDTCIMNAFEIITKIGGYIIMFSIFIRLCQLLPFSSTLPVTMITSFLEISNGIGILSDYNISFSTRYILCMALSSFGGWCSIAQTKSIITHHGISILPYTLEKLATAFVASLLSIIIQL